MEKVKTELAGVIWYMQEEITEKVPYITKDELVEALSNVTDPNVEIAVFVDPDNQDIMSALKEMQLPAARFYSINSIAFRLF